MKTKSLGAHKAHADNCFIFLFFLALHSLYVFLNDLRQLEVSTADILTNSLAHQFTKSPTHFDYGVAHSLGDLMGA